MMIDAIYIAAADTKPEAVLEKSAQLEQRGLIHSKTAGRFEVVKEVPEKSDSLDDMFSYADVYGKLKLAYINSAHKISPKPDKTEKQATAIGGELGFKTAQYKGVSLNAAAYVSQGVNFLNPSKNNLNEDFFAQDVSSFAYLAEASLDYQYDMFSARVGRIKIETPYANSDDIRMAANTFEGASVNIDYTSNLKTEMMFVNRWAGYDSQDEDIGVYQDEFKDLVSDNSFGMVGVSLTYKYDKNSEAAIWYNHIDDMSSILYGEIAGIYFVDGENFHFDYGVQASKISELSNSGVDGKVFGIMSIAHYYGAFLGAAYNVTSVDDGKYITDGFGGGPYYTSLDEATISAVSEALPGEKAESYRIGMGYEFENIGIEGLVVEFVNGKLYNNAGDIKERDVILTYEQEDRWSLGITYTKYDSSCNNNSFDRTLVKLEYIF